MSEEQFPIKGDLGKAFSKMVDSMYLPAYLGCHIEKVKCGSEVFYKWNGKIYDTLEEAKGAIQSAYDILQHSLTNKK